MGLDKTTRERFAPLLRWCGFRVTPGRLLLLSILARFHRPISIETICSALGKRLDRVTVYRALGALVEAGIVRRIEMGHGHADYELADPKRHHHHLTCKTCGRVEDIDGCDAQAIMDRVRKKSKDFLEIEDHALEFFGRCARCRPAPRHERT